MGFFFPGSQQANYRVHRRGKLKKSQTQLGKLLKRGGEGRAQHHLCGSVPEPQGAGLRADRPGWARGRSHAYNTVSVTERPLRAGQPRAC